MKKAKLNGASSSAELPEVLTLAEAAAYLRVSEDTVSQLAIQREIPARKIGKDWRILKAALQDWLRPQVREGTSKERMLRLAGTWKDDPTIEEMMREIYRARGRSEADIEEFVKVLRQAGKQPVTEDVP